MDNNEDKKLTKIEKIAITLNVLVFAIVLISGVIRILVECDVIRSFKDSLAYSIVDGIFILIAVILLVIAYVLEKRIKNMVQSDDDKNNKNNETKLLTNKQNNKDKNKVSSQNKTKNKSKK